MKNKALWIGIGIVVIICIIMLGANQKSKIKKNEDIIYVGAILPLTGAVSEDGQEALVGVKIAEEILNSKDGKRYKVLMEDGKYLPKDSISALQTLLGKNPDISAIIAYGVVPVEAMVPVIKEIKKPLLATAVGAKDFPNKNNHLIRVWFPIGRIARLMGEFSFNVLENKKVATFGINNSYGLEAVNSFAELFESLGGKIVGTGTFDMDSKDTRPQLIKMLNQKPDAFFVSGFGQGYISALNQLRELGFSGVILTDTAIVDPIVRKSIKSTFDIYFADTCFNDMIDSNFEAREFKKKYKEKTSLDSPSMQAQFTYEAAILSKMISELGSDAVLSQPIDSIIGKIAFDENGEIILPIIIRRFVNSNRMEVIDDKLWESVR